MTEQFCLLLLAFVITRIIDTGITVWGLRSGIFTESNPFLAKTPSPKILIAHSLGSCFYFVIFYALSQWLAVAFMILSIAPIIWNAAMLGISKFAAQRRAE